MDLSGHRDADRVSQADLVRLALRDTLRNVEAANALGLHGIHFTSPEALERELRALGLLTEQELAPSGGRA